MFEVCVFYWLKGCLSELIRNQLRGSTWVDLWNSSCMKAGEQPVQLRPLRNIESRWPQGVTIDVL